MHKVKRPQKVKITDNAQKIGGKRISKYVKVHRKIINKGTK